jgi:hypothetical protein
MPSSKIASSLSLRYWVYGAQPAAGSVFYENFPRDQITSDSAIGATTLITAVAMPVFAGDIITKISFCVGATAGATLTHNFVVLYSAATVPLLLAQSTDAAQAAMAANTVFTGTLTAPFTILSTGFLWAGILVTGTTIPTLLSKVTNVNATAAAALNTLTGLTNGLSVTATGAAGAVAPATMASITQLAVQPYCLIQ